MKKYYLHILLVFILLAGEAQAQTRLQYGQPSAGAVVSQPYFSWDLLRTLTPGWVREYRPNNMATWNNFTKIINKKDGQGRFTHLEYALWDPSNQVWSINNSYKYTYIINAGNQVAEQYNDMQNDNGSQVLVRLLYDYDAGGRPIKTTYERENQGLYTPYAADYHLYNGAGKKIKDSTVVINNLGIESPSFRVEYEYDGNNRCTKETSFWYMQGNWDTVGYNFHEYAGNNLAKSSSYSIAGQGMPIEPYDEAYFTYTAANKVDEVNHLLYDTASKTMLPYFYYKHLYDGQDRLATMISKEYNGADWDNIDSIALNYLPNGQFDTGYQYVAGAQGWASYANYRLIFEHLNTGVKETAKEASNMVAYPNPATDKLALEFDAQNSGPLQIHLTDITGKKLQTIEAYVVAGKNSIQIPLYDIAPGIYLLDAGNSQLKIIKE